METVEELKSHLYSYGLNCKIQSYYDRVKKDSPNWGWNLIITNGSETKIFQLWRYGDKRYKLIKEFLKFAGKQQILFT